MVRDFLMKANGFRTVSIISKEGVTLYEGEIFEALSSGYGSASVLMFRSKRTELTLVIGGAINDL